MNFILKYKFLGSKNTFISFWKSNRSNQKHIFFDNSEKTLWIKKWKINDINIIFIYYDNIIYR